MRLITWLFSSAEALYYVVGVFIGIGGLLLFIGTAIHRVVMNPRRGVRYVDNRRVNVHVENLNLSIDMTRQEVLELMEKRERLELPPGGGSDYETW